MRMPFPEVVDNTILNTFRSCPRRAFLQYVEHWKSPYTSVHLHAGGAFAHGLETARRLHYEHGAEASMAVAAGLKDLIDFYGDYECPPDSAKSLERMVGAFEYYLQEAFPMETDPAKPMKLPSGRSAVEFSFAEPLPVVHPETGNPILYSGRADMIVSMANGCFVMDDKTTSSLGASWANQWEMRGQFTGYCWAARQNKMKVDGVLVRGVAILKTKFNHAQHITYRPDWEVDRWFEQSCRDLERMKAAWESGYWDYNLGEACNEYGGCLFADVCKKPNPEEWLEVYYNRRKWNPLTRQEEIINA